MKKFKCMLTTLAISLTGGCADRISSLQANLSATQIPSPETEKAYINALMEPIVSCDSIEKFKPESEHHRTWGKEDKCFLSERPSDDQLARYLNSGFGLSDVYCDRFFRDINRTHRTRKFGRSLTNDVGGLIQTITGLTSVSKGVVTGIGASITSADAAWRNYDDAFVVSPNLDVVRSLVMTAQDEFRATTYKSDNMPKDYQTSRSVIIRYAGFCSFLGMQSLMNKSIEHQTEALKQKAQSKDSVKPAGGVTTPSNMAAANVSEASHQSVGASPVPVK